MQAKKTALILIGYQNDYFSKDGVLRPVIEMNADSVLENTLQLLQALQDTGVTMISTPILFTEDYHELHEPVGILKAVKDAGAFRRGTFGAEAIPEFRPYADRIIEVPGKRGLNAFAETGLDALLHERGIEDVVLAGAVTSICIDSTGRSAHERGFRVHMLKDATCGRTFLEQDFYCNQVFPLYADIWSCQNLISALAE
ncbi:cysteine hydrolase [Mariprofundus erugo]|uniref:cysteine hydrolase n=1 Tax=Mariprofundus erugo TaxID=2528639 RepID=UPI0010FEF441|nr:cysteine hydrolase [Mariprofundus erugo]TLS76235.1 cysteine hydrolase [Mariprofundus erugo]